MRVLLIESDARTAKSLEAALTSKWITVTIVTKGEEAINTAYEFSFDAILLDIDSLDIPGFTILKSLIVTRMSRTPIILMSKNSTIESKAEGFRLGADDYVVKPFHSMEIVMRLNAMTRRLRELEDFSMTAGNMTIDVYERKVRINDKEIHLEPIEYRILEMLALQAGKVVHWEEIVKRVFGNTGEIRIHVNDYILSMRKKLVRQGAAADCILSVGKVGFRLKVSW